MPIFPDIRTNLPRADVARSGGGSDGGARARTAAFRFKVLVAAAWTFVLLFLAVDAMDWTGGRAGLHTILETVSAVLALTVGGVTLVRHFARPRDTDLLLGSGFLAVGLLDAFHAVATTQEFAGMLPSTFASTSAWTWNASRLLLAAAYGVAALAAHHRAGTRGTPDESRLPAAAVFGATGLVAGATVALFLLVQLGPGYVDAGLLGRPQELLAGALFTFATVAWYREGSWHTEPLEFWVLLSLLANAAIQLLFIGRSFALYDAQFDAAHGLKVLAYGMVLAGLLSDMRASWRREDLLREELWKANEQLERRVQERTEELKQANEALVRSLMELHQFAYIASHDLQTPLRGIAGYVQLLRDDYKDALDDRARVWIERTVESTERMSALIRDLLSYSRLESRAQPFREVDLSELFDVAQEELKEIVRSTGAVVTRERLPVVRGDALQLLQLLEHLLQNAMKFTGPEAPIVHASAARDGDGWVVTIQDNGIGIESRQLSRIFEIFRRLHTPDEYPGTGIGLAICRRVTRRHGGEIWAESVPGHGSRFSFRLPTSPAASPQQEAVGADRADDPAGPDGPGAPGGTTDD